MSFQQLGSEDNPLKSTSRESLRIKAGESADSFQSSKQQYIAECKKMLRGIQSAKTHKAPAKAPEESVLTQVERMLDEFDQAYSQMQADLVDKVGSCMSLKSDQRKDLLDGFFTEVSDRAGVILQSEAYKHIKKMESEQAATLERPAATTSFGQESKSFNPNLQVTLDRNTESAQKQKRKAVTHDKENSPERVEGSSSKKAKKNQSSTKKRKKARNKENCGAASLPAIEEEP